MARDIETYLGELQAALMSAGADPALVQDALFDAEEHLQAEMVVGGPAGAGGGDGAPSEADREARFAAVVEGYGSPEEVAAAYVGAVSARNVARTMSGQPMSGAPTIEVAPVVTAGPGGGAPAVGVAPGESPDMLVQFLAGTTQAAGPAPGAAAGAAAETTAVGGADHGRATGGAPPAGYVPTGVQYGMQAAGTGAAPRISVWRQIFGPFAESRVWTSLIYMLLSLGTGIAYFTIVVTGLSTAGGMLVLIIGIPLFMAVLGIVRALALFEGRLVEALLGERMPRRQRATPPNMKFLERMGFWLKDGRTWASMAYMLLMLPLGVFYFTIAVTGLALGLGLVTTPFWAWTLRFGHFSFVYEGATYQWWFPAWGIPLSFICGVLVLIGMFHLIKWIGRGHAMFAKAMLVRLK